MKKRSIIGAVVIAVIIGFSGIVKADLNDGLVAYYPFNGNVNDMSSNGNNGIESGLTYVTGVEGQAANFDGNGQIEIGDTSTFKWLHGAENSSGFSFTTSFWMQLNDHSLNDRQYILSTMHWTGATKGINIEYDNRDGLTNHDINMIIRGNSTSETIFESTRFLSSYPEDNNWHLVTITYEQDESSDNYNLYIDGEKLQTESKSTGSISSSNSAYPLHIGSLGSGDSSFRFIGALDEVRIYNRALSESEIQELYNDGSNCEGGFTQSDIDAARQEGYSEGYSAGLSANSSGGSSTGVPATVGTDLSIYIPSATFGSSDIWVELEYKGTSGFDHIWKLSDYGYNQ